MTVTIESILTKDDVLRERTPRDLFDWVQRKCLELSSYEELREYCLLRKGLCGEFYTEVYPLSLLVHRLYASRSDIFCRPNLTNENFDAQITDYSSTPPTVHKIEFTQAIQGHEEHLRMVYLLKEGWVSPLGEVLHRGTKRTGFNIAVENIAVDRMVTVNKGLNLIFQAALGKSRKRYGKDTSLVIVFDDYVAFRTDDEVSQLEAFTREKVLPVGLDFARLYLLGWSGNTLLEFCS